jgi:hypothetical protein
MGGGGSDERGIASEAARATAASEAVARMKMCQRFLNCGRVPQLTANFNG